MGRDVVGVVPVFDECGLAAFVFRVGETRNEDTAWQRISAVRSRGAAGGVGEVVDGLDQLRFRRIGVDVEDEDLAALQTGEPELAAVVGEAAVVRFVAAIDGNTVDDFAVVGRAGLYVDGDKFVRAIAQTFYTECPNIDELFLTFDPGEVRRGTGFIGERNPETKGECERERGCNDATRNSCGL